MTSLADLLAPRIDDLVERWTGSVRSQQVPDSRIRVVLLDHAAIVRELVAALRGQRGSLPPLPLAPEVERFQIGFDLDALGREYQDLRGLLFDVLRETGTEPTLEEMQRLIDFLSRAMAAGVTEYGRRAIRVAQESLALASEARRTLLEREAWLSTTLSSISDAVIATDVQGRITFLNPVAETLTGWSQAQVQGRLLSEIFRMVNAQTRAQVDSPVDRALQTGLVVKLAHHTLLIRQDGSEVPIDDSAAPIRNTLGEIVGAVLVFRDITARMQIEGDRERLVTELTRSNLALDQFAHVVSHDLRAPLRGIASLATWIEDDLGDTVTPDAHDKFVLMGGRVHRLDQMITGILDFATAGRSHAEPELVDPRELLAAVIELLAPPPHIILTVGDPMPSLVVDRVALQQVLMNLLGNAIKHTQHPDAAIRVDARDEGAFVHFTVADNGPGIAAEHHERIWGLFQKLTSRTGVEGTGIGLSVVKKAVESRGGQTWVESVENQGATFHVLWPRLPLASESTGLASELHPGTS